MSYTIGVSSGYWEIGRKEELLGFSKKIQWTTTAGVMHTQVDLENVNEFLEEGLKDKVKTIEKTLGITFGIHGEAYAMGGIDTLPLASALETDYIRAHERLLMHIQKGGDIGAKYITIHSCESTPFILLGQHLQPTKIVDFYGRPFQKFFEENPKLIDWFFELIEKGDTKAVLREYLGSPEYYYRKEMLPDFLAQHAGKTPDKDEEKKLRDEAYQRAKERMFAVLESESLHYGPERIAYYIIAKWMQETNDPLWKEIVRIRIKDDDLSKPESISKWVPAVTAKYIWGHFNPRDTKTFPDPKSLLAKYKMYFCFEAPMSQKGYEIYMRLARLPHLYAMTRNISSPWVGYTMDMEHMMGCNLDPEKEIKELPHEGGKLLKVVHITVPAPYNPSHMPVPLGSEGQVYIYKRLFELRKKGFTDGWLIFERGGDEGQVKQSVLSMRMIVRFLEKDILPEQLPEEFFGMPPGGPEISRQFVAVREHALDPLRGLLAVPEEEHGFLGSAAVGKGKGEEWRKEKYR